MINDSDFVSRRRRARVFDILPAFLLPDVFSILAQTIRSSLSDLSIQKRERRRFLQPRDRNVRYATSRIETEIAAQRKFEISRVLGFLNCNKFRRHSYRLKFYNYLFKKRKKADIE